MAKVEAKAKAGDLEGHNMAKTIPESYSKLHS